MIPVRQISDNIENIVRYKTVYKHLILVPFIIQVLRRKDYVGD